VHWWCLATASSTTSSRWIWDKEHDLSRGVTVVNAETPSEDFEAALDLGMPEARRVDYDNGIWRRADEGWEVLTVEHLEDSDGAQFMDLTDPVLYDLWAYRLAECNGCDGTDDLDAVRGHRGRRDGAPAGRREAARDFGLWYAAFRRLLQEIDVPNWLATAHSLLGGGHLIGGNRGVGRAGRSVEVRLWRPRPGQLTVPDQRPASPRRIAPSSTARRRTMRSRRRSKTRRTSS
jgi:hypothetical protein